MKLMRVPARSCTLNTMPVSNLQLPCDVIAQLHVVPELLPPLLASRSSGMLTMASLLSTAPAQSFPVAPASPSHTDIGAHSSAPASPIHLQDLCPLDLIPSYLLITGFQLFIFTYCSQLETLQCLLET